MNISEFEKLLEDNRSLLSDEMYSELKKRIGENSLSENMIQYVSGEIISAKKTVDIAGDMDKKGEQVYKEASEKIVNMEQGLKNVLRGALSEAKEKQHEADVKSADELLNDL